MGPTHGKWCNAVTWPTKCPGCGHPVFFFRCDCGSKVFFDELGDPWPIHDCDTSWTKNLIRTRDDSGGITVELAEGITVHRAPDTFSVERSIVDVGKRRKKQPQQEPIIAVDAEGGSGKVTVIGILREKQASVDVAKALKMSGATTMLAATLGPLGKGEWGKVTVHEPSSSKNILHSYTIWVPTKSIKQVNNSKGITVCVDIEPVFILGFGAIWISKHYEVLG